MHCAFATQDPMEKVPPQEIPSLMTHSISLISVPGTDVIIFGPYRDALAPLLEQYGLDTRQRGEVILPCVTLQIPVIKKYHPNMKVIVKDAFKYRTQSSFRTVTVPGSNCKFSHTIQH